MADTYDIQSQIADDITAALVGVVGTTYSVPEVGSQDWILFGPTRVVPNTLVIPGNILLEELMTRLELGKAQINVEAAEIDAPCPQYLSGDDTDPAVIPTSSLSLGVVGNVCTISGAIHLGDVIGIILGINGAAYAVQVGDTLTSIATALSVAAVANGIPSTHSGPTVTVTGTQLAQFNTGTSWTRTREAQRRRKLFYASIYAATPYDRSVIGKVIETMYTPGARLLMPDGTRSTLVPVNGMPMQSSDFDGQQRDTTWLRRVSWLFDFISVQTIPVTQVVATQSSLISGYPFASLSSFTPPLPGQL